MRDDPIIQKLADTLMHQMNRYRQDYVDPAPPAGMADVCQLLADRNSITHILQHHPGPASDPPPPPDPRPPAAVTTDTTSPVNSAEFGGVTCALLGFSSPGSAPRTGSGRLSISRSRAANQSALNTLLPPAPPPDRASSSITDRGTPPAGPPSKDVDPASPSTTGRGAPPDNLPSKDSEDVNCTSPSTTGRGAPPDSPTSMDVVSPLPRREPPSPRPPATSAAPGHVEPRRLQFGPPAVPATIPPPNPE